MGIPAALFMLLLVSCLFDPEYSRPGPPGFLKLSVRFNGNPRTLLKIAAADTIFQLDSLKVVFTAPNTSPISHAYPIQGRPDTGVITLVPEFYSLPSLRNWTATLMTLDTTMNPNRTDTVHLDSVSFTIRPGDTTEVSKTLDAAFSILKVRLVSLIPDSLTDSIQYLRIRIDGVTRDSLTVGNTLRAMDFLSGSPAIGFAAGEGGRLLKTANSGGSWSILNSGTTQRLNAVSFPPSDATHGWVAGDHGIFLQTSNGGGTWSPQSAGTSENLTAVQFPVDASTGFVAGDAGSFLKTQDGGAHWSIIRDGWFSLSSGTAQYLSAVAFADTVTGWTVGNGGTLLKTGDGGENWSPQSGVAQNLNDVVAVSATSAYAVGGIGTLLHTSDGSAWSVQASGTASLGLNGLDFLNATAGIVVGDSETILRMSDGTNWSTRSSGWFMTPSGTSQDLRSIWFTDASNGWAVGSSGTIVRTFDGGTSWSTQTANTSNGLNAVHFASVSVGVAVGASGTICYTSDGGSNWNTGSVSGGSLNGLNAVAFVGGSTTIAYAVGDNGLAAKTTDGGANWTFLSAATVGAGSGSLNAIAFQDANLGIIMGNSGVIRKISTASGTQTYGAGGSVVGSPDLRSVTYEFATGDFVAAGDGGSIFKTANFNVASPAWTTQTSNTSEDLTRVHFINANNGFAVGVNGALVSTTNKGVTWTVQDAGTTLSFAGAYFPSTTTGFIAASGGVILKTVNSGANWSGAVSKRTLRAVSLFSVTRAGIVGDSGLILRSTDGDSTWTALPSFTTLTLRSIALTATNTAVISGDDGILRRSTNFNVASPTWTNVAGSITESLKKVAFADVSNGFVVSGNGTLYKTTDGGVTWAPSDTASQALAGVAFNADLHIGFAVGAGGTIVKTTSGGTRWASSVPLNGLSFVDNSIGWVVGAGGLILSTTDGGRVWTAQTSNTSNDLNAVSFLDANNGQTVGDMGTACRTKNGGALWSCFTAGTKPLRSVALASTGTGGDVYAVSDSLWKCSNFAATQSWVKQPLAAPLLNAVDFTSATTGFVAGGLESVLSTSDGTTWNPLTSGTKLFDTLLTYKYLKPNKPDTILMDAMVKFGLPLKGYQKSIIVNLAPGKDSTMTPGGGLVKCGYEGPVCE